MFDSRAEVLPRPFAVIGLALIQDSVNNDEEEEKKETNWKVYFDWLIDQSGREWYTLDWLIMIGQSDWILWSVVTVIRLAADEL